MRLGDNTIAQVVTAYELMQLNEYAIADQLDIPDIDDVRGALLENSPMYRERNCPSDTKPLASHEEIAKGTNKEFNDLHRQYTILAKTAESEVVREKALRWLMDNELGRNDVATEMLALRRLELTKSSTQEERLAKFNALIQAGMKIKDCTVDTTEVKLLEKAS